MKILLFDTNIISKNSLLQFDTEIETDIQIRLELRIHIWKVNKTVKNHEK